MEYPDYCYVEGAFSESSDNKPMIRHLTLKLDEVEEWSLRHKSVMLYTSNTRYSDETACTAKHWKGKVIGDMCMDIDHTDIPFIEELVRHLEIPALYVRIYFSGMKGFHVEIPHEAFAAEPSDMLPQYYKYIAKVYEERVLGKVGKKEHRIDLGRFSLRQLWRVPNSLHLKSGLYKIPITYAELCDITLDQLKILAQSPRRNYPTFPRPGVIIEAAELYEKAKKFHAGLSWWTEK